MKKQSFKEFYGREAASEVQQGLLKENTLKDYKMFVYLELRHLFWLKHKFPKNKIIKSFFNFNINAISCHFFKKIIKLPNYQQILEDEYNKVDKVLREKEVNINIDGVNDVAGWDWINAEYTSWFFDQRISITSGTCYFAHALCRCLQPYIIDIQENRKNNRLLFLFFKREFRKTIVGILTNNHWNALTDIFLIPEDDSLLSGIENFVILHELGHAYAKQTIPLVWPYETKSLINNLEKCDEEVFADIFAIHSLFYIYIKNKSQRLLLFAPVFFFLINSFFEKENLVHKPKGHPLSSERTNYLLDELQFLCPNEECVQYVAILNKVWELNKSSIVKQVKKFRTAYFKYEYILDNLEHGLKNLLDQIII